MPDVELSVMIHTPQTADVLQAVLDEFTTLTGIHVHLTTLRWETAQAELNRVARYHHGPDVSEIGSTWVCDLIAMNALRPFSAPELAHIARPKNSSRNPGKPAT